MWTNPVTWQSRLQLNKPSLDEAIAALTVTADAQKAVEMAAYHKVDRPYWGVANPEIDAQAKIWRRELSLDDRLNLSTDLWGTNVHEARVCAAKIMTQARIKPDDNAAWELFQSWVPDFDAWAIADHAVSAGQRRLMSDLSRIEVVETWTTSDHLWTRRAAMVITLPLTKLRDPKPVEIEIRERVLGWAASYVDDPEWFIQKSVSWWLRELSRKNPDRVREFLEAHGARMKNFARKDASRLLP